jgi:hypothetical protein
MGVPGIQKIGIPNLANMLPTYPYATCWLNIVSSLADTVFGRVANMLTNMSATCQADKQVSVDLTIF